MCNTVNAAYEKAYEKARVRLKLYAQECPADVKSFALSFHAEKMYWHEI